MSAPAGYVQDWNPFKWIAKKVKKVFKKVKKSLTKSHRKAVDAYNNHTADFKKMSRWQRFKWAVSNPLAWIRGGREESKKDTEKRNKKKEWIEQQAAMLAGGGGAAGGAATEAAGGENQEEAKAVEKLAEGSESGAASESGKIVEKAVSGSGGGADAGESKSEEKAGDKAADENADGGEEEQSALEKASDINDKVGDISDYAKSAGESLGDNETVQKLITKKHGEGGYEKFSNGLDIATQTVGLVNDVSGVVGNGLSAAQNWKKGDNLEFAKNIGNGVGDLFAVGGDIAGFAGADPVSGALEAVGNGIKTGVSIGSAVANQSTKSKLRTRQKAYEEQTKGLAGKENLSEDEKYQLMRARAMGQGKRAASIRRNQDIVDATSSGLKTVAGVSKLAGGPTGAAVGGGLDTLSSAAGFVGGRIVKSQKRTLRRNTVNEELNLDAEIEKLKKTLKGPNGKELDTSTAKKIILKSKGFKSGKRKEAFNKITEDRANALTERANRGDAEEVGIMKDMFVGSRKNDQGKEEYNADTVAEKLGKEDFEAEEDNPFAKILQENEKKKKKK